MVFGEGVTRVQPAAPEPAAETDQPHTSWLREADPVLGGGADSSVLNT